MSLLLFSKGQVSVRGFSAQNHWVTQGFYTCSFWGTVIWSGWNQRTHWWMCNKVILLIDRHAHKAGRRSPPCSLCDCGIVWCLCMNAWEKMQNLRGGGDLLKFYLNNLVVSDGFGRRNNKSSYVKFWLSCYTNRDHFFAFKHRSLMMPL